MRWFHVLAFVAVIGTTKTQGSEQADAKKWLKEYNIVFGKILNNQVRAEYTYNTDITDEHQKEQAFKETSLPFPEVDLGHGSGKIVFRSTRKVTANVEMAAFLKEASQNASSFNWKKFKDADIKRQMKKISDIGPSALKEHKKVEELNKALSDMQSIYSKATVFLQNKTMNLEPGLTELFASSRDYDLLTEGWKLWRDASGAKMKTLYQRMVELSNEGSKENGYHDTGAFWRTDYEDDNFQDTVEELLVQLKPIYTELHTYIRKKLKDLYGADKFPKTGQIPAHILGNMWAQTWNNIYSLVIPYPNKPSVDVTDALKEQNYTVEQMFKTAESFFVSLNLEKMVDTFWTKSMLTRPEGREVVCHASAWDFYDAKDFRIKMCTRINMEDLITIHHEMGHIEYFQLYKEQPQVYRDGANPGFHEAVGDTMALSVATPKHLREIGLLKPGSDDQEAEINFLMSQALDKIAFLPFGYLIDQWRWSVFSGETTPDDYNQKWWDLRCKYQGIAPPVERGQSDFDPGAKFHIPGNVPYIRYFVSFVVQFQFHQALCKKAGHTGPLHRCDIYKSQGAGKLIRDALSLGSSKPWPEVMQILTGQSKMDTSALQEYFKPLTDWLIEQNKNEKKGWDESCPETNSNATAFLKDYNKKAQDIKYKSSQSSWKYATNITESNKKGRLQGEQELSEFTKEMAQNASSINWQQLENWNHRRQFRFITNIGTDAMKNKTKIARLSEVQAEMESIFSKGKVCIENHSKEGCLNLEPGIARLFSGSRDYNKLKDVWKLWRDETGKQMKLLFKEMVELSNEGVKELGYKDTADYWKGVYDTPTLEEDLQDLLRQLQPLYRQLHTYVRKELIKVYGPDKFPRTGHIPAHLLGNIWAQEWNNLLPFIQPYKHKQSVDVTPALRLQNFTATRMFRTAEHFFKSIGLDAMPATFWNGSMIERPSDGRDVVCYAAAWDMGDGKDFRIKMCTDITMEDLITIHHEMGHVEYFLQYKDQPSVFRDGANPGFHEAIGDTIALSVSTPKHLRKIGLLPAGENDYEADINYLMKIALEKIAFLPFGYLIDQWRWSVFSGETTPDNYNRKWWDLRCKYQGISPPVKRTEEDFDPGAKYHVAANVPYIRYFISFVIQFQFHQSLCREANQTGPLHTCDIYNSLQAGTKLKNMLKLGSSVQWQDAMELITGQRKMEVGPLLEYFKPLMEWLEKKNGGDGESWTDNCPDPSSGGISDLEQADKFLDMYNERDSEIWFQSSELSWAYNTNLTDYNAQRKTEYSLKTANFAKEVAANASMFDWENFHNETRKRQFSFVAQLGTSAMKDVAKLKRLREVENEMESVYSKGKVCLSGHTECMSLEPGLTRLLRSSSNYSELTEVWEGWRDATGPKIRPLYQQFVELSNEGYRAAGYNDTSEAWISNYETENFKEDLQELLEQLKPLYQQLHTYVRGKLIEKYGKEHFPSSGHIPAHLMGNMWAQTWSNIFPLLEPYPGKGDVDVTPEMLNQNYTVERMFRTAEEFFLSLGLKKMPNSFWNKSMLQKPTDGRDVVCHASAWDFGNTKDFRIKMCTDITMEDLITIHHEMGHIRYYLQYKDQPTVFRGGANPGFHEAVGDVLAISVATPRHLNKIGLLPNLKEDNETDLNFLMSLALDKIAFLPFGYLIDQWRWSVFRGQTPPDEYNRQWWDLRCKYQGISPPTKRTEDDFDPGAKYHVPANTPYIRYFVSFVIQFQFHKALCQAANHTGPLYKCDIYQSKEAGQKLANMLSLGTSKPWPEAMEAITGQRKMDVRPLVEFFTPLLDWLEKQNSGKKFGWSDECPTGTDGKIRDLDAARKWLKQYDNMATDVRFKSVVAEYTYSTNITKYNSGLKVQANLASAKFDKSSATSANTFDWKNYPEGVVKRQFQKITDIGTSALKNTTKLARMESLVSEMEGIYSVGKVNMSDGKALELAPGLTKVLAESRNYDKLLEAWKGWRDSSGKLMKTKYEEFVHLSNEGVQELGYKDTGDYWRSWYESKTFQQDVESLLHQLHPLYKQLHGYVRKQLKTVYGDDKFPYSGHIPAHLLGNMWAQHWNNIYDLVEPYKNKTTLSVTNEMKRQEYTVEKMFWTAEDFFKSLGLEEMPMPFWKHSMIRKPDGRDVVCHASAWDFYNKKDFRIKMCTDITMEDLITIHHEMGHIQYYLQYKDQPVIFRRGGNPGFHEAIGDTMALSASTPNHLRSIGLLKTIPNDPESDINFLMSQALQKIAFLPFGYLIDQWRWSVFSGETVKDNYNRKWWDLRCKYQGISPPVKRTEEDFDPGAKYHIPANTPYIRYFVSYVIQFQFHKGLCQAANHTGSLRSCDIYGSKAAGEKLAKMLKLGSSKPWPEAMKMVTGSTKMDASALMEYFQPLIDWLKKENEGEDLGWDENCPEDGLIQADRWLKSYDKRAEKATNAMYEGDWAYQTNITDYTSKMSVKRRVELDLFKKKAAMEANQLDWKNFKNTEIKRQFKKITNIGPSAMKSNTALEKMQQLQSKMEGVYGAATVCLEENRCYPLEPDLTRMMAKDRDSKKLKSIWELWRDKTGRLMKTDYSEFVKLSNMGVREIGYKDTGEYWRSAFESETFIQDLRGLLKQLHPLYEQLHTYVRMKLKSIYPDEDFPTSGHIPAHLLGNMWAQQWNNIYDILQPYKNRSSVDVTPTMKKQNYTVKKIFRTAEYFFLSLGLKKMPDSFWTDSLMEKPKDGRNVVCHASAWDFYNAKDFRIKMCTDINMEDLVTVHHEMGHIQYFLQYSHFPQAFRDGANPGFHEAVGDTLALSVSTPGHLRKIGLLKPGADNQLDVINFLMKMALEKIAFLPFGYLIDQWRWSVFSGETTPDNYNQKWWNLRCKHQGIFPPVKRTEDDFDPGAKYHIPDNTPYIRYFVSFVIQFQFHKALCQAANHTGPLYKCDIYQSKAAGKLLGDMLSLGASKPWPEAMEKITGQRKMDAQPLLDYFQPLMKWLQKQNLDERPGWSTSCPDSNDFVKETKKGNTGPVSTGNQVQFSSYVVVLVFSIVLSLTHFNFV